MWMSVLYLPVTVRTSISSNLFLKQWWMMKWRMSVVTWQAIKSFCKLARSSRINGRKLETQNNNLLTSFKLSSLLATDSLLYYAFHWKLFKTLFSHKFLCKSYIFIFLKVKLQKDVREIMPLLCFSWDSYSCIINSSIIVEWSYWINTNYFLGLVWP